MAARVDIVLVCVVPLLAGCMEARQSVAGPGTAPPSLGTSPTAAATEVVQATGAISPTLPGSFAPDPATGAPTAVTTLTPAPPIPTGAVPAAPLPTLALPTPAPLSNEERWRAQQIDRRPFGPYRHYFTVED